MWKNLLFFILAMVLFSGCKTEEQITIIQKQKHTELIRIDLNSATESRDAGYLVFHAVDDEIREYILFVPVKNLRTTHNESLAMHQKHSAIPISPEALTEFLDILNKNIQLWKQDNIENEEIISSYSYTSEFETRHITGCGFRGCNRAPGYSAFKTIHVIDSSLPSLHYKHSYSEEGSTSSLKITWAKAEWDITFEDKNSLIKLRDILRNARESISDNKIAKSAWLFDR